VIFPSDFVPVSLPFTWLMIYRPIIYNGCMVNHFVVGRVTVVMAPYIINRSWPKSDMIMSLMKRACTIHMKWIIEMWMKPTVTSTNMAGQRVMISCSDPAHTSEAIHVQLQETISPLKQDPVIPSAMTCISGGMNPIVLIIVVIHHFCNRNRHIPCTGRTKWCNETHMLCCCICCRCQHKYYRDVDCLFHNYLNLVRRKKYKEYAIFDIPIGQILITLC
jgi:hypothetical protein